MIKQKILIVDDEPVNISVLVEILGDKYELLVSTSGKKSLEICESEADIDLILLDIVMPEMDGYQVAYKLKHSNATSHIPFIFLTSKTDSQSIVKGFREGAVDYISKPFSKEELLVRIKNHLQAYKLKNALSNAMGELNHKVAELDNINEKLNQNKNFLESILEYSTHAVIATDIDGTITLFSKAAEYLLGYTPSEVVGIYTPILFHDMDEVEQRAKELSNEFKTDIKAGFNSIIEKSKRGLENKNEWKYISKDKKKIFVRLSISALRDENKNINGYIGIIEDITEKHKIDNRIKEYVSLIDKNVIVSTTDLDGNITYVSDALCKVSGYSQSELIGVNHRLFRHKDMNDDTFKDLWETVSRDEVWHGEVKNKKKDGTSFWANVAITPNFNEDNIKTGYTAIREDISDKKRVEELSITDELTLLYNRRHFNDVFLRELNRAKRDEKCMAFLMLDVDYFKAYNDIYGHQEGDIVLSKVGKVLQKFAQRAGDFSFRLGGEEFGLIFSERSEDEAFRFSDRLRQEIKKLDIPHKGNKKAGVLTVSIGLVYKESLHGITTDELYKETDEKLYRAKEEGRDRVII